MGRANLHPLALNTSHYLAIVKLQADLEIGKSAAIQLMLNFGLYSAGYLDEETYKLLDSRYREPLKEIVARNKRKRENSHISKVEIQRQKSQEQQIKTDIDRQNDLNKLFQAKLLEWSNRDLDWRLKTYNHAKKYSNNENAKRIIAIAESSDMCRNNMEPDGV